VHELVVDRARVARADDLLALGVERVAAQALVGHRPVLDLPRVAVVEAGGEAADAELVEAAPALGARRSALGGRTRSSSSTSSMRADRRARGLDPRPGLPGAIVLPAVLDAEPPDQRAERQALHHHGHEDRGVDEEDDQVALGKPAGAALRARRCGIVAACSSRSAWARAGRCPACST